MTASVGKKATIVGNGSNTFVGVNGHNYLTGTINATLSTWQSGVAIDTFLAPRVYISPVSYNRFINTGDVNVTLANGLDNKVNIIGDFDDDGALTLKDFLISIRYFLDGFDESKSNKFYGEASYTMRDSLRLAKKILK